MASSDAIGQEAASAALMMLASEEAHIRALIVAANGVRALVSVLQVRVVCKRVCSCVCEGGGELTHPLRAAGK